MFHGLNPGQERNERHKSIWLKSHSLTLLSINPLLFLLPPPPLHFLFPLSPPPYLTHTLWDISAYKSCHCQRGHWGRFTSLWRLEDVVSPDGNEGICFCANVSALVCYLLRFVIDLLVPSSNAKLPDDQAERGKDFLKGNAIWTKCQCMRWKELADKEPIKPQIMLWNCTCYETADRSAGHQVYEKFSLTSTLQIIDWLFYTHFTRERLLKDFQGHSYCILCE